MANAAGRRRRAGSLRTQMFNKHLYNKFTRSQEQHIELREISEGSGNIDEANETTSIEELELEVEYTE